MRSEWPPRLQPQQEGRSNRISHGNIIKTGFPPRFETGRTGKDNFYNKNGKRLSYGLAI